MKRFVFLIIVIAAACGGRLSDEQRQKMKEGMEDTRIKIVTDARLTEAAFDLGRKIAVLATKAGIDRKPAIDSIELQYHVEIVKLEAGDSLLKKIEQDLVEAYTSGTDSVSDNIQKIGADTLLYTKPVMKQMPSGAVQFNYALGIRMPKKEVVRTID